LPDAEYGKKDKQDVKVIDEQLLGVREMKKITQWGAIFSLFFCLVSFAMAGDIPGNNQAQGLGDDVVQNSPETQWRQAFSDAASGNSGFSRVKNMDENILSQKQPQEILLGRWVCRTNNGDINLNFISENQLNFNGDMAYYTSTADKVTVQADGQVIIYPYYFSKKGLVITFPEGTKALFVQNTNPATAAAGKVFPQLVGEWKDIRSSGNTIIKLMGDGQYAYYSDFAASNSTAGEANWGTANANHNRGTWRAKGTPRAGTIFYKSQDGTSDTLSYQVHVENGRIYWGEYYFDRIIYVKQ